MVKVKDVSITKLIVHLQQQCHNSKFVIFRERVLKFWNAIIFSECDDDTTALQRRVSRIALCHYLVISASANISFHTSKSKMPDFELRHSCRKWALRMQRVCQCLRCMCHTLMSTGDETHQSQVTEISTRKRAAHSWNRGDFEEGSSLLGTGLHAWWKNQTDSHISGRPG